MSVRMDGTWVSRSCSSATASLAYSELWSRDDKTVIRKPVKIPHPWVATVVILGGCRYNAHVSALQWTVMSPLKSFTGLFD